MRSPLHAWRTALRVLLAAAVTLPVGSAQAADGPGTVPIEPFRALRAAYAARDPAAAAAAYADDAVVEYRYDGAAPERHRGRPAIAASFAAFFDGLEPGARLDLNFRITDRRAGGARGLYRLRVGRDHVSIGTFDVDFSAEGRFARDVSTSAPPHAFEEAPGPVLLDAPDDALDRDYYDRLAGRYRRDDGCDVLITRSVVRLFALDTCTGTWRGLNRRSGREWTSGSRVLSDAVDTRWRFEGPASGPAAQLIVSTASGVRAAKRVEPYRVEPVAFHADDGEVLKGRIYIPRGSARSRAATVLVHGSGPQDRDGYASILAVLADAFASAGRVVLVYDKRGTGESGGDGERAGFDRLADDATAAMRVLRARADVDPARVGLAGSSQAGWVVARAVQRGAAPVDVLLLGAAGSGVDVATQNLWNTAARMRCEGFVEEDVALALAQQRSFFDFLSGRIDAVKLDSVTARAAERPALRDWLFPDSRSIDASGNAWYSVLQLDFDPLPVWLAYRGRAWFVLAEHDDSTPSEAVRARLNGANADVRWLDGAQHLGLRATGPCAGELRQLDRFDPRTLAYVREFAGAR